MEAFESLGVFWRQGESDAAALSGRLSFDPQVGCKLELVGSFDGDKSFFSHGLRDVGAETIHGWASGKAVTLLRCYASGGNFRFRGVPESSYMVNAILRGAHVPGEDLRFHKGHLRTSGGTDWVGRRILGRSQSEPGERAPVDWLDYCSPLDDEANFDRGKFRMRYCWSSSGAGAVDKVLFEHWPSFTVEYSDFVTFDQLREDLGLVETMVTLCADQVSSPEQLTVRRSDFLVRMASGEEGPYEQEIEHLAPPIDVKTWKRRHPHQMLLTYDEVGGAAAVARWLDVAPTFQRSLNSLMSVKHAGRLYGENRFLNVAFAAEAFHRDSDPATSLPVEEFNAVREACLNAVDERHKEWLDQRLRYANEITLRNRLRGLFERMGAAALPFLEKSSRWIGVIAGVRNALTHLSSRTSGFDGGDLYYLSESLFALVRACMLDQARVSADALARRSGEYQFAWYSDRLNETVERLRRQL